MKNVFFKIAWLMSSLLFLLQGCYKDLGSYDYTPLPDTIGITFPMREYTKALGQETLEIVPEVAYAGQASDLSYEWQRFVSNEVGFVTFATEKNLNHEVGGDEVFPDVGAYTIRLAVRNNQLKGSQMNVSQTYSDLITVLVRNTKSYLGLMVLHGDGTNSDVGLIENNIFAQRASTVIQPYVRSNFYSIFNSGNKVPGVGKKVTRVGSYSEWVPGSFSHVYIFTDKVGYRTDYRYMAKLDADYSALLANPSLASGTVESFGKIGTNNTSIGFVDQGRLFYNFMFGPLEGLNTADNTPFSYKASPHISVMFQPPGFSGLLSSLGIIGFDELSGAFLYSLYEPRTSKVHKFPNSQVNTVNFNPRSTNAELLHLELRTPSRSTMAVMRDRTSRELFLVDMNLFTPTLDQVVKGRYSLNAMPEASAIKYYAFGGGGEPCSYYATDKKLYQFFYTSADPTKVVFTAPGSEEITMVKFIKTDSGGSSVPTANGSLQYQFNNRMLIVATVDGQKQGKVYAFGVDLANGILTPRGEFNGAENGSPRFGTIYDVDIKTQ